MVTTNQFGKDWDIDDLITRGVLPKMILEIVFVNESVKLGIIGPHGKAIFGGCKVKSFCK